MRRNGGRGRGNFTMNVITNCSNRKRRPIAAKLHAASLPRANQSQLAAEWGRRLAAQATRSPASELYGGRGFQEAVLAANCLRAELFVASAGLGLIRASSLVPAYACTILPNVSDSIADRVTANFSPTAWWRQINRNSPFALSLSNMAASSDGMVCVALSQNYLSMIEEDLMGLDAGTRQRLRFFTAAPLKRIAPELRANVMPYDERLDGADSSLRGTRSDFASRALHHFARTIIRPIDCRTAAEHAEAVHTAMQGWRRPQRIVRLQHDDESLRTLLHRHWDAAGGNSSRLLRIFRDQLNVACEQGRFATLARQVREERT
jgi:hypothetical protein